MTKKRWLCVALSVITAITIPAGAWAGGGIVALQTAASSCPDNSGNIYVDCGNGTVTDNRTGLVWLAKANCFGGGVGAGFDDWFKATEAVSNLADLDTAFCVGEGLTGEECDCDLRDGSSPGEWRLPTASELKTMISDAIGNNGDPDCTATPPTITDDTGAFCYLTGSSFYDVMTDYPYWSTTIDPTNVGAVYGILLSVGIVQTQSNQGDPAASYIWPVRGGQ